MLELYDHPEELTFLGMEEFDRVSENGNIVREYDDLTDKMSDKQSLKDKIRLELSDKFGLSNKMSDKLSDIVSLAVQKDFITTSMVVSLFDMDERNARRYLTRLVDVGYLLAEGENKNKKYRYRHDVEIDI